mgnify:FL=1
MDIEWKLRQKCAEKNIWSAAELQRLKQSKTGLDLSHTAVNKLFRGTPSAVTLKTLFALCYVIECSPTDLIHFDYSSIQNFIHKDDALQKAANDVEAATQKVRKKRLPLPPV